MIKVAFQGERGAYSEEALLKFFKNEVKVIPCQYSEDVFESIRLNKADMAIVPVENSIVGNVSINMDLLYKNDIFCFGEVYLPISHCLLATHGTSIDKLSVVSSHPIALDQCRNFIKKNNLTPIPYFDTAGSAKNVAETKKGAAIASKICAKIYSLELIKEDIQSIKNNITRFLIFKKRKKESSVIEKDIKYKTSIAIIKGNNPGSLLEGLSLFSKYKINLTRLESHPIVNNPFEYFFFIDFEGHLQSSLVKELLNGISKVTKKVKIIGTYEAAIK